MTDLDRLWEYQQARQRLVTFARQILSAPDHQRLGKLPYLFGDLHSAFSSAGIISRRKRGEFPSL